MLHENNFPFIICLCSPHHFNEVKKMKMNFIKASTCRNTTAFFDDDVDEERYSFIARRAMEPDYLAVEQVGFLARPHNSFSLLRLEMAGGEFCGNATLALAALAVRRGMARLGDEVKVECSGEASPLIATVEEKGNGRFGVRCSMPGIGGEKMSDAKLLAFDKEYAGGIVNVPGISHFLFEAAVAPTVSTFDMLIEALASRVESDAYGVIAYHRESGNFYTICPYVYVPSSGSRVFEQACGSGSLSLGAWLSREGHGSRFEIGQPGGTIKVEIGDENYISADVYFPCEGEMSLDGLSFSAG